MANAYVDPIKEIHDRLNVAKGTGLKLSDLKTLQVGSREQITDGLVCPAILLDPDIFEENVFQNSNTPLNAQFGLLLHLKYPTANEYSVNVLFDASAETGVLYYITKVLDVINTTQAGILANSYTNHRPGGTADPLLNNTIMRELSVQTGEFEKKLNFWVVTIRLQFVPKKFQFNGRET